MSRAIAGSDELRRARRFPACCRVDVCQPFAAWTAVTEELSVRGCRILTGHVSRLGAILEMTLSSDLFDEALETEAEVVWVEGGRVGVLFRHSPRAERPDLLSPAAWVARVLEHGRGLESESERVVPAIAKAAVRSAERSVVVPIDSARARARARSRRLEV